MAKKSNRKSIATLADRVTTLEASVAKLVIALERIAAPTARSKTPAQAKPPAPAKKAAAPKPTATPRPKAKPAAPKPTPPAKPAAGKPVPTLMEALKYVLNHHQDAQSDPVKAAQLYDDVQAAGYKFGGSDRGNNLNYLNKLLRTNKAFKKAGDAGYALA